MERLAARLKRKREELALAQEHIEFLVETHARQGEHIGWQHRRIEDLEAEAAATDEYHGPEAERDLSTEEILARDNEELCAKLNKSRRENDQLRDQLVKLQALNEQYARQRSSAQELVARVAYHVGVFTRQSEGTLCPVAAHDLSKIRFLLRSVQSLPNEINMHELQRFVADA